MLTTVHVEIDMSTSFVRSETHAQSDVGVRMHDIDELRIIGVQAHQRALSFEVRTGRIKTRNASQLIIDGIRSNAASVRAKTMA